MGMIIDGVFGSQAIDSSGEVLDVAGCDISSLNDGTGFLHNYDAGFLDWEHLDEKPGETKQAQRYGPLGCVGRILFAKKIFKEADATTARERAYWDLIKLPFVYGQTELFDDTGHEQAKALAAIIRHYADRGLPIQAKHSVEGTVLSRDPHDDKILRRCIVRKIALTCAACNKSAISGLVSDPHRPAQTPPPPVFGQIAEPTWKSEDPAQQFLGSTTLQYLPVVSDPLAKGEKGRYSFMDPKHYPDQIPWEEMNRLSKDFVTVLDQVSEDHRISKGLRGAWRKPFRVHMTSLADLPPAEVYEGEYGDDRYGERGLPGTGYKSYMGALSAHMRAGGALPPVFVHETPDRIQLLDGNHRIAAAEALGLTHVPVVRLEDMEDPESGDARITKTLTAGAYNVAPGALTGGAALQREALGPTVEQLHDWKNRGLATVRDWNKAEPIREVLRRALTDASPEFIDGFARMVEDFQLKKGQSRLVGDLGDYVERSQLALGKGEPPGYVETRGDLDAERARLAAVGYMEQERAAGAFSCGACRFASEGFCGHDRIVAHISATHGCCNEFRPREGAPVPAPEWSQGLTEAEREGLDKGERQPIGDEPLTIGGQPQAALPTVHEPQFDTRKGVLYTQRGAFPVYIPHRDPRGAKAFDAILADPKVEAFHGEAMKNWSRLHKRLRKGKVPPEVVMHAVLFSQLSPNTPVSVQELMYGHLVDAMRATGTDPRDPQGLTRLKRDWMRRDRSDAPPEHAQDYFEALPGAHLAQDSKTTDREAGDLSSFMLANEKFKHIGRYHELHDALVKLIGRHREDARGGVEELMAHKHAAQLHEAARDRALDSGQPDPGPYTEGPAVPGLAPKTARYMYGMLGGGNVVVPDTHFVRHIFGLTKGTDARTISYLKDRLWEPHHTHLLNGLDAYYARHHDAVRYMVRHPKWGQVFESPDDALFPAFWRHWVSIAPHERARGMPGVGFQETTTHRPFWEAVNPYLAKAEDGTPVAARTARTHRAWANEYGDVPALFLYFRYLVPELMGAAEAHEDVHKAEATAVALRQSWEDLVKAEGAKVEPIHFAGQDVIPGEAWLPDGAHAILHEDDTHYTVVPQAKRRQWAPEDLRRIPKDWAHARVESKPQPVGTHALDAHRHGLGSLGPEQVELLHGLDLGQAGAWNQKTTSDAAARSRWIKGPTGPVFVKMDNPQPRGAQALFPESHREAAFYGLARDFFGMGDLVPRTAAFRHPVTGEAGVAVEAVDGRHWHRGVASDPAIGGAMVRHGDSGLLDRVRIMDHVLGNADRHNGNYMLAPDGGLRLIDHGLAFTDWPTQNESHMAYLTSAMARTPAQYEAATFGRHPLAPATQAWVMGLRPEKLELELMRHGVPGVMVAKTLGRLNKLQAQLGADPTTPKSTLWEI